MLALRNLQVLACCRLLLDLSKLIVRKSNKAIRDKVWGRLANQDTIFHAELFEPQFVHEDAESSRVGVDAEFLWAGCVGKRKLELELRGIISR